MSATGTATTGNTATGNTATGTSTAASSRWVASLPRTTVVVGLGAAAVTTAFAAVAHAAGVPFEVDGEMIPLLGFAQMTFLGAVIGGVVLGVLNRRSRAARRRFVQIAVALTALSFIPSIAWPDHTATKLALVALHILPAVLVVPALARHARS